MPAKLGDLYRGYLLKKESRISFSLSMGTVVAERLLDFVVLVTLMGVAGLVSYRGRLPQQIIQLLSIAFAVVLAVIVGLFALRRFGDFIGNLLPGRAGDLYSRFSGAMLLSFQRFPELMTYTILAWACESARVLFVVRAEARGELQSLQGEAARLSPPEPNRPSEPAVRQSAAARPQQSLPCRRCFDCRSSGAT